VVKDLYDLPDIALLDMGDFLGGVVKYLAKHPVSRLTIAGGIGKITKAAQGAIDLHSGRSQVDFAALAERIGDARLVAANTALEAYEICPKIAAVVASDAQARIAAYLPQTAVDVVIIDRAGAILARTGA
jgi:cobalt-precorrin-5B (C1)-methyltransferase